MAEPAAVDEQHGLTIEAVVRAFYQDVYRYAYRLAGNEADAADLAQQTFFTAQRKLDQVREADKVNRWLFSITRTCFLKSRRRQRPVTGIELPVAAVTDHDLHRVLDQESLQLALDTLSDDYRVVIVMFYFEDLSYKEIAEALDLPIGTVMSRLSRAKSRLREALKDDDITDQDSQPS